MSIDRDTEQRLARCAQLGDRLALQELVAAHESLVRYTARRFRWPDVPFEDLLGEGRAGLLKAAQSFEPERGTRFGTYARWWVRAYMRQYATRSTRVVSPPATRSQRSLDGRLRRTRRDLQQRHGGPVSREELARALDIDESEVELAEAVRNRLDVPVRSCGAEEVGVDLVANDTAPDTTVMDAEEGRLLREGIERGLASLDSRRRYVVSQRYLIDEPRTLSDLGAELGVSRERVRQLEAGALRVLRNVLREVA